MVPMPHVIPSAIAVTETLVLWVISCAENFALFPSRCLPPSCSSRATRLAGSMLPWPNGSKIPFASPSNATAPRPKSTPTIVIATESHHAPACRRKVCGKVWKNQSSGASRCGFSRVSWISP